MIDQSFDKKSMGRIVILVAACVVLLLSNSFLGLFLHKAPSDEKILSNQINAFNALYDYLSEDPTALGYNRDRGLIDDYTVDAGLDYNSLSPFSITFVDAYIEKYSFDVFMEKLYTIYTEEYYYWDCTGFGIDNKCEYQMINDMLTYALKTNGIDPTTTVLPPEGSPGFYADYPEKVPESSVSESQGKFYNSSGENVHYQTSTNTVTGSAHGDFAIRHEVGNSYDGGKYGWDNGVFYDELPSWTPYNNSTYYYKGTILGKINLSTTEYFSLGNCTYFLLSPEDCRNDKHQRREWVKVDVDEEALAQQAQKIRDIKNAAMAGAHAFILEVLMDLDLNDLYDTVSKPEVRDSLTVIYPQEIITDEQYSIDAVYSVKIGMEYLNVTFQLTGNLNEETFCMTFSDINASIDEQEAAYATAESLLSEGKDIDAAIAFGRASGYSDAAERSFELWKKGLKPEFIGAGSSHVVALNKDGSVVGIGNNNNRAINVSTWRGIHALAVGDHHTVGLKADGTVIAVGRGVSTNSDLFNWKNIVSVSAGSDYTMGLKNDGTVVIESHDYYEKFNTDNWTNIIAISGGDDHAVGLRVDGTVVAVGDNYYGQCKVSEWTDIIAVSAGYHFTIGLKSDGTVVATGDTEFGRCDVSQWTDIVAISAGVYHAVGLKSDGTVVATKWKSSSKYSGMWYNKQSDVSDWRNIVSISAGWDYTIGLKADGTMVAVGKNNYGQCDVNDLKNIQTP